MQKASRFSTLRTASNRRGKRAAAAMVAAILIFAMLFSVAFGYFYITGRAQNDYQQALKQQINNNPAIQESFSVAGFLSGNLLGFYVNNTGPSIAVVAYWVYYSNGTIVQFKNSSATNPLEVIGQGSSNATMTGIFDTNPYQIYMFKVLSSRGTTSVGSYPNSQTAGSSLNSIVAGGIGDIRMVFSSFTWYSYVSGPPPTDIDNDFANICSGGQQCNNGQWLVDMAHPHSGSFVPSGQNQTNNQNYFSCYSSYCGNGVPIVFSVNVTNYDPTQSTIVVNSEANLWVMEVCDTAAQLGECAQGVPFYVFYIMNLNPSTGVVTSLNKGGFSQITLPYGVTTTLYFGAGGDLSKQAFTSMLLTSDDSLYAGNNLAYYGQFAVFVLFAGTKIPPTNILVYGQNIPFESSIAGDNLGWFNEVPTTCNSGFPVTFQLTVNDSIFSGSTINQVVVNASALTGVSTVPPTGWSQSVSNGYITWQNTNQNNLISAGQSLVFQWTGSSPTVSQATMLILPVTLYWSSGFLTTYQGSSACFDNGAVSIPKPKLPPGILHYVPIVLTNLQNTPVAGGTQVMISVNWGSYSPYLDNPVDNVLFFDYSGNPLNAWLESGTANSANNAVVWVQLNSSGIQPMSSITIYMGFYALNSNYLSAAGPFGEAPQLSSTFGQYDDGAKVFNYYNAGGSTSGLSVTNGGSVSVSSQTNPYGGTSSVLSLKGKGSTSTSSETVAWNTNPVIGDNFVIEGWVNINTNLNGLFAVRGGSSSTTTNYLLGDGWTGAESTIEYESGGTNKGLATSGSRSAGWYWDQGTVSGNTLTTSIYYSSPYEGGSQSSTTSTSDNTLGAGNQYIGLATWSGSTNAAYFFGWRIRINPPNGANPIALFGPLT